MNKTNFFIALLIGASSSLASALMIEAPDRIGTAAILLFPGFVLAIVTSGNVHDFSPWVVSIGNFAFYAGLVYLGLTIWERYRRRFDSKGN